MWTRHDEAKRWDIIVNVRKLKTRCNQKLIICFLCKQFFSSWSELQCWIYDCSNVNDSSKVSNLITMSTSTHLRQAMDLTMYYFLLARMVLKIIASVSLARRYNKRKQWFRVQNISSLALVFVVDWK